VSENMWLFYQKWTESEEYHEQSAMENSIKDEFEKAVRKAVGQQKYDDNEDDIFGFANEAEQSGFSNGFRLGVLFMGEMVKGGAA